VDDQAVRTSAVVINPKSGRGRGKGVALAEQLQKQQPGLVDVLLLNDFAKLTPALQRFTANGITDLFISSGDGTIQAIQTWLAENTKPQALPRLCLLPHGTTNMTAADIGFTRTSIADQASFIAMVEAKELKRRPTLRIANPLNRGALHGMFFGTGAVADATRYCQTAFNDKGVGGNWATFATLATVLGKSLFSAPNPNDQDRFDRPYAIQLEIDGQSKTSGDQLLMLATTLEKLILSSKPFWGGAHHPLRTTTIPYPVPNIWRWILPTLYGSETRASAPGSTSTSCVECRVTSPTQFVLDGEFYDAPAHEALRLETGPMFDYIVA
jgi:diacylglycerol kinase (ATP)